MSDQTSATTVLSAAESRMWSLVDRWTARAGYQRGAKADRLTASPPVIDCSGWVALLLIEGMCAENEARGGVIFDPTPFETPAPWSDRIIVDLEAAGSPLLTAREIAPGTLPRLATIGVNEGFLAWQTNRPRVRGINHIAQVVRRPADEAPFVSESYSAEPAGVRLTPLDSWLKSRRAEIDDDRVWVADGFAGPDGLR